MKRRGGLLVWVLLGHTPPPIWCVLVKTPPPHLGVSWYRPLPPIWVSLGIACQCNYSSHPAAVSHHRGSSVHRQYFSTATPFSMGPESELKNTVVLNTAT